MYAQIIDDTVGNTLVAASTLQKDVKAELEKETREVAELLEQAADLMAQAKACHDELETYYRAAVDFGKVDEAAAQCAGMLGLE